MSADKIKILLVEDNPVNCEVAVDMLESFGVDVDVAINGQQALELFQLDKYKMILMDCEMPVMDGFSTTEHIRTIEKDAQHHPLPIIALTAHASSTIQQRCKTSGMDDFLSKPFDLPDLDATLQKWQVIGKAAVPSSAQSEITEPAQIYDIDSINSKWNILSHEVFSRYFNKQKKDGSKLVSNIINIYLTQSAGLLVDLTTAVNNKDIESARIISHTLKSSSENVGALILADSCRTVELSCTEGLLDEASVKQIFHHYSAAEEALLAILDSVNH